MSAQAKYPQTPLTHLELLIRESSNRSTIEQLHQLDANKGGPMSDETNVFDNWIDTSRAAELTGYRTTWLQEMARKGKVTAQKLAGRWVFNKSDLLQYKHKMDSLGRKKHALQQETQQ